jgi:hypothetical protein
MSKALSIAATAITPEVHFNAKNNILEISGRSIPLNPEKFWSPVMSWFIRNSYQNQEMSISLNFDYINSGSQKFLVSLFKLLKESNDKGILSENRIIWNYQDYDEDMRETGQDFEFVSGLKFEFNELTDEIIEAA